MVSFFRIFEIKFFLALVLLYVTWCTIWGLYMSYVSYEQHLVIFSEISRKEGEITLNELTMVVDVDFLI